MLPLAEEKFLPAYKSVKKRLFIKVDFPRPDSPEKKKDLIK